MSPARRRKTVNVAFKALECQTRVQVANIFEATKKIGEAIPFADPVREYIHSKAYGEVKVLCGCLAIAQSCFRQLKAHETDRTPLIEQARQ